MKPSLPKGTRDFSPEEVFKRNFIFDVIKSVFEKNGYQPIETPVMENLSTLTGKYGEEGDKLLFKVLNNGDFLSKADPSALESKDSKKVLPSISKRGLRYDLTVPFARYVVMHRNDLVFPFKRYQIQPVWRADRPQKGRYQEFYQCDADAIGSTSLSYEAEYVQMIDEVFFKLGMSVDIIINNRKILAGIAEVAGVADRMMEMTIVVDKLDKIGWEGVIKDLQSRDFSIEQTTAIKELFSTSDIKQLSPKLASSSIGIQGIDELLEIWQYLDSTELVNSLRFSTTLARGLNYYTGCIFEVKSKDVEIGSILGGGRYDDLTGVFGMKDVSGVGISFGVARIFDVMTELSLFPETLEQHIVVLAVAMDEAAHKVAFEVMTKLRKAGISSDLYPDPVKMKKQMKYANARGIPYVLVIGSEEMASGLYTLKNMATGEQIKCDVLDIIKKLKTL